MIMDLKSLRKKKGLTQSEAAEIVGLSRRGYQNLEMGSYLKKDSKTTQYVLGRLEELPNKRKSQNISSASIAREFEYMSRGYAIEFVYFLKEKDHYEFVVSGDLDDLDILGLEEELSLSLRVTLSVKSFVSLIKEKEEAKRFFLKAKKLLPQ